MEKYKGGIEKKFKPQMQKDGSYQASPFKEAHLALSQAVFSKKEREEFFNEAYGEIMSDLFMSWVKTSPHCTKEREYLYHIALGLGSVKERLITIETYGLNQKDITEMGQDANPEEEQST